jgi:hypothetical protein
MKSRVTADQEMRQLNVKLAREDSEFVQDVLRPQLGLPYNAEAVRELIARLRTWFYLPVPVVRTLEKDAELHIVHIVAYLQMLLHQRYESLVAHRSVTPS